MILTSLLGPPHLDPKTLWPVTPPGAQGGDPGGEQWLLRGTLLARGPSGVWMLEEACVAKSNLIVSALESGHMP